MEEVFICPFCGRNDFKSKKGLTYHVKYCKENPDRIIKIVSDETKLKLSEASKRMWENPETKQKISEAQKGKTLKDETKRKISAANKGKTPWNKGETLSDEYRQKKSEALNRPEVRQKLSEASKRMWENPELRQKIREIQKISANRPETRQKEYETKKKNNSFNTSKIEEQLKEYFTSHNINFKTQYKSDVYPWMCDFYFPDKDLYVEIQGTWTHGGKPFDASDIGCINQLGLWKSKNKPFYLNAIDTWTNRDVRKRNYAKEHGLNWIEIFSDDFETCITEILKLL